jgi:hypothetical protein
MASDGNVHLPSSVLLDLLEITALDQGQWREHGKFNAIVIFVSCGRPFVRKVLLNYKMPLGVPAWDKGIWKLNARGYSR